MRNLDKLQKITTSMIPAMIQNTTGGMIVVFPSPEEVKVSPPYPGKLDRIEILMHKPSTGSVLHTHSITYNSQLYHPRVVEGLLETPQECVVCNAPAVDVGILESTKALYSVSSKLTINAPNATRLWSALQSDRFWFTFPVCSIHKDDFHEHLYFDNNRPDQKTELKLDNIPWGREFIKQNKVIQAYVKTEDFFRKRKLSLWLIYFGVLTSALAITSTILIGSWGWLIPTLPVLIGGLYLFFTNRYEVIVSDSKASGEGNRLKWYEGLFSLREASDVLLYIGMFIGVAGLIFATMKTNGENLSWPWYIKAGIIALGVVIAVLSIWWQSKIGKQK